METKHTERDQKSVWNGRDSLLPDLVDDDGRIVPLYGQSSLAGIGGTYDRDDRACRYNQAAGARSPVTARSSPHGNAELDLRRHVLRGE